MLDALIRWSVHNRLVVLALAAAFLGWGTYVATRMPVDVLPDLTSPTVTVLGGERAMVFGSVTGSFAVEEFSVDRFRDLNRSDLDTRVRMFREMTAFEHYLDGAPI